MAFNSLHTILLSLVLFTLLSYVSAHGFQSWPRARGLMSQNGYGLAIIDPDAASDYCPHCLNGGGVASVQPIAPKNLWTPYEPTNPSFPFRKDHEICGDPKGKFDHTSTGIFFSGKTIATYEEGDYMDMEMHITAHHNGFFEYFLCSLDCCGEDDLSERCFKKGCCHKLMRVPHKSCESGFDRICGPVDPEYPGRWYLPPRDSKTPESSWYGGNNKKMRYALPKGVTCEKCVLHWSWTTANSCNPPGYKDYNFPEKWTGIPGDGGAIGGINLSFDVCGSSKSTFPEEFWSCSENIKIARKSGGKKRTLQIFKNSDMNIEGPQDSTSGLLLKPLKEPKHTFGKDSPKKPMPVQTPEPVLSPGTENENVVPSPESTPVVDLLPPKKEKEEIEKLPVPTSTPPVMEPLPSKEKEEIEKLPVPTSTPTQVVKVKGSKFNLGAYVRAYDTGVCVKAKNDKHYCEACLDLGYGSTKCLWCHQSDDGKENCTHRRPTGGSY